jgi:hypothetical protein
MMTKIPGYYTTDEAAEALGIKPDAVRQLVKRGVFTEDEIVRIDERTVIFTEAGIQRRIEQHDTRGKKPTKR